MLLNYVFVVTLEVDLAAVVCASGVYRIDLGRVEYGALDVGLNHGLSESTAQFLHQEVLVHALEQLSQTMALLVIAYIFWTV